METRSIVLFVRHNPYVVGEVGMIQNRSFACSPLSEQTAAAAARQAFVPILPKAASITCSMTSRRTSSYWCVSECALRTCRPGADDFSLACRRCRFS